ncbi:transcriptional activator FtrA [Mycobacteroides salmoniphilum]|uniref:Transcriptional activator FtrA n=1 Tax=Mycobacteroides salmoniphilum TaxID=404941 RepID=A0A4R8SLL7_9MYCO|nr:transcriptional activator FtrA [Mycobacteroides salmoniphilum]TEA03047.1 transcriptional activator FtrA [Mycobacteroides salmoniphilum]
MLSRGRDAFPARAEASGPTAAPLFRFQPPVGTPYGLEVTTLEYFRKHHDDWPWSPPLPGRATFHYLILVTEGELWHDVDHVTHKIAVGQWLWVRPGHVQCWHDPSTARGPFILFNPEVLRPDIVSLLTRATAHDAPAVITPHPGDTRWLQETALQLLDEHRAFGRRPLAAHHALRCSLLEAMLLRLAGSPDLGNSAPRSRQGSRSRITPPSGQSLYARLLDAVELHFRDLHHVEEYAQLLGCSTRTLSRATKAAADVGARQVIDQRRALEARRLLVDRTWTARAVAAHLGFTDTANFGRFFRHHTGLTPAAYANRQDCPSQSKDRALSRTGLSDQR